MPTGDTGGHVNVFMVDDPTAPVAPTEDTRELRGRRRTDSPTTPSRSRSAPSAVGSVLNSVRQELQARWQRYVDEQRREDESDTTMEETREA